MALTDRANLGSSFEMWSLLWHQSANHRLRGQEKHNLKRQRWIMGLKNQNYDRRSGGLILKKRLHWSPKRVYRACSERDHADNGNRWWNVLASSCNRLRYEICHWRIGCGHRNSFYALNSCINTLASSIWDNAFGMDSYFQQNRRKCQKIQSTARINIKSLLLMWDCERILKIAYK